MNNAEWKNASMEEKLKYLGAPAAAQWAFETFPFVERSMADYWRNEPKAGSAADIAAKGGYQVGTLRCVERFVFIGTVIEESFKTEFMRSLRALTKPECLKVG